jgi:CBS-domain-containing membrane protein
MEIRRAMITPVITTPSAATIAEAAKLMARHDIGALPVLEGDDLLGIVTDRDITVRGTAMALDTGQPVARVMTCDVATCRDIALVDDVLDAMVTHGVRRIPILSKEGKLVGIVSLSDLARIDWDKERIAQTFADTCSTRRLLKREAG